MHGLNMWFQICNIVCTMFAVIAVENIFARMLWLVMFNSLSVVSKWFMITLLTFQTSNWFPIFYKHILTLLIYFLSFSGFQSRLLNHWTRRSDEPHECQQRDVCPRPASSPHDPGSWGPAHAGQWGSASACQCGQPWLQTWSRSAARSGSQWQGCQQWRSR